jgi:unsaturated chondroitin disaccharide hydrolase
MTAHPMPLNLDKALQFAVHKVEQNLAPFMDVYPGDLTHNNFYPIRRGYGGQPDGANIGWTPGFWPGMIWLAYELSGEARFRQAGEHHVQSFLRRIEQRVDVEIHDLGFMYSPTCVAAWILTGNTTARRAALLAAEHLMTRFWPAPGIFQAWGSLDDPNERGRTIIDSLMNMPLLYWASRETGDPRYQQAAHRHTCQLRDHFIRPDQTTFHTYYFDVVTGAGLHGRTAQGARDDSCWARGQAWGIYGFALNHRYTGDASLLQTACRLADTFLSKLPGDKVAYWDLIYGDGSGEERDSSAAAIAVCGLMEMANLLPPGSAQGSAYRAAALEMLASLAASYTSQDQPGSNAILLHGVGHKPGGVGIDEASLWGDYYYLEALTRLKLPNWTLYW